MRWKTTAQMFFCVCLVGALIWILEGRVQTTDERQRERIRLLSIDPATIERLEFAVGEWYVVCVRMDGHWRIERPLNARADTARIQHILARLESAQRIETITPAQREARELSLAAYGLDDPPVRLIWENELERRMLLCGRTSPVGDQVYVKLADSGDVLVTQAALLHELPRRMEDLRDRALFVGDPFRISRLEIEGAEEGFTQLARVNGRWEIQQPFAARANEAVVAAMLNALYAARIREFVWEQPVEDVVEGSIDSRAEAYRLMPDDAVVRVGVWTEGGHGGKEILFGKTVEPEGDEPSDRAYARFRDGRSIVTVPRALRDAFMVTATDLRDRNLFPVTVADVERVQIDIGDRSLVLRRDPRAGWMVTEPVQWKADEEIVKEFVQRVASLRAESFLDPSATNLADMGLAPPALRLRLGVRGESPGPAEGLDAAGSEGVRTPSRQRSDRALCIGRGTEDGQGFYARFDDEERVFEIDRDGIEPLGVSVGDPLVYRDRTMLAVDPANVTRLTRSMANSEQQVVRDETDEWRTGADGSNAVYQATVDNVMFHVSHLRALRVAQHAPDEEQIASYGLDRNAVVLTLGLSGAEGIQKKLVMGAPADAQGVYAMVRGTDVVFVLAERVVRDLTAPLIVPAQPAEAPDAAVVGEP